MDWIKQVDWNTTAQWVAIGVLFLTWLLTWLAQRRARYGIYRQELYRQRLLLYRRIWQLLTDVALQDRLGNETESLAAWERLALYFSKNFLFMESSVFRPTKDFVSARAEGSVTTDDITTAGSKVGLAIERALALEPLSKEIKGLTTAAVKASKARPAAGGAGPGDLGGEGERLNGRP